MQIRCPAIGASPAAIGEKMYEYTIHSVAHIENDFLEKFGIPRQSGLVEEVTSLVVFEPEYRTPEAIRGLEGFSHLWLLWAFEDTTGSNDWTPTVRPPKLGGNTRMGVFATRSPNRPNHIGLSCVRLVSIIETDRGYVLEVAGADLRNGTPIYDIKPYLPYVDSRPDALGGFADRTAHDSIEVIFPDDCLSLLPENKREAAVSLLAQDPRPSYHNDPERIYGINFGGFNIRFKVKDNILLVVDVLVMEDNS